MAIGKEVLGEERAFNAATFCVRGLLIGDNFFLEPDLDLNKISARANVWCEIANNFSPPIRDRIAQLREAMQKGAGIPRGYYPEGLNALREAGFDKVKIGGEQIFLSNVFYARVAGAPGEINQQVDLEAEAQRMKEEILGSPGILSLESLTLDQAIALVLRDSLKLYYQAQAST